MKSTLLGADLIVFNSVKSGQAFAAVLSRLGIAETLKPKIVRTAPNDIFKPVLTGKGNDMAAGTIPLIATTPGMKLLARCRVISRFHPVHRRADDERDAARSSRKLRQVSADAESEGNVRSEWGHRGIVSKACISLSVRCPAAQVRTSEERPRKPRSTSSRQSWVPLRHPSLQRRPRKGLNGSRMLSRFGRCQNGARPSWSQPRTVLRSAPSSTEMREIDAPIPCSRAASSYRASRRARTTALIC